MHFVNSRHGAGTILLASAAQPRYYEYTNSTEQVVVPKDTRYLIERGCSVVDNFNTGLRKATGDWVWFLGDDHEFAPDTLLKLLDHDVDVVVPISPIKIAPFTPCVLHGPQDDRIWHPNMELYEWDELSGDGLLPLPQGDFIGQAGMLVKKHVLDAIGDPWFKCGQLDPGRLQEDMYFCHELQKKGFTVWIDQNIIFDHFFIMGVTARKHEGKYTPAIKTGGKVMILPDLKGIKDLNTGKKRLPEAHDLR
jgi:glycosyltransferase involved in cell wall biosynthesis